MSGTYRVKGNPSQGLFGATLGFFSGFAAVALFGPTATQFKDLMQLSPLALGLLIATPSLSGSLLRIPFSAWVDTTGGRKPFLILLTLSIMGMMGLSLMIYLLYPAQLTADLYPLLLLLGVLSGCGIATFSVGISQVSYWFPQKRQGRALGVYAGVGNLAPGIFSLILPVALSSYGLAVSYLAWLIFLVSGTVLYYFMGRNAVYFQILRQGAPLDRAKEVAREHGQEIFPSKNLVESLTVSAKIWKTWALVVIYFTTFGGFIALTAWFPTYWRLFFAVNAVTAGLLTALYSILASLARVAGGVVSDRAGSEKTIIASLLTMLVGVTLMTVSQTYELSVAAEIAMALGMGVCNAAVFKHLPQEVPKAVGGAAGWVGGIGAFGGFTLPLVLSAFVREYGDIGYARGFIAFIFLTILALAMAYLLRRGHTHPERASP